MSDFTFIFVSQDFEKAVKYYRDALKLPVAHDWDRGPGNKGSVFQAGNGKIEILALKPDMEYKQPANFEISMEVDDVDAYYAYIQSIDLPIKGELANKPWGQRTFSLTDPDGIKLIFYNDIVK